MNYKRRNRYDRYNRQLPPDGKDIDGWKDSDDWNYEEDDYSGIGDSFSDYKDFYADDVLEEYEEDPFLSDPYEDPPF